MKENRYITVQERIWNTEYSLEYKEDKAGQEYAILKVPYTKWTSDSNAILDFVKYKISGAVLACIEKEFFDKDRFQIPVANFGYVHVDAMASRELPEDVYNSVITGTYQLPADFAIDE